ncbi:hypothetical protein HEMA109418_11075 [Helcobacillus massiliensis]
MADGGGTAGLYPLTVQDARSAVRSGASSNRIDRQEEERSHLAADSGHSLRRRSPRLQPVRLPPERRLRRGGEHRVPHSRRNRTAGVGEPAHQPGPLRDPLTARPAQRVVCLQCLGVRRVMGSQRGEQSRESRRVRHSLPAALAEVWSHRVRGVTGEPAPPDRTRDDGHHEQTARVSGSPRGGSGHSTALRPACVIGMIWLTLIILGTATIGRQLRSARFLRWIDRVTGVS